jgi:hypothetical protein
VNEYSSPRSQINFRDLTPYLIYARMKGIICGRRAL